MDRIHDVNESLHAFCQQGELGLVEDLIDNKKADVNAKEAGVTPLHTAVVNGHVKLVELLLKNEADVNARRDNDGATPLYAAAERKHVKLAAAERKHVKLVRLLLENGANVDASRTDGNTPLYVAVREGHVELVELLLKNGADVNASRTDDGATPLHAAAVSGHVDVVKLLLKLDNKADINARKSNLYTPLHSAIRHEHVDDSRAIAIVKLLLESGADKNAKSHLGETPLKLARCRHGDDSDIAKLLEQDSKWKGKSAGMV